MACGIRAEYGPLTGVVLPHTALERGGDADTSQDYEYSDCEQVEEAAAEFAERLAASEPT